LTSFNFTSTKMKKILIAGGTGLIGTALLKEASAQGMK
jgi:uncharacterized protein YbjT (DUF2867 family)